MYYVNLTQTRQLMEFRIFQRIESKRKHAIETRAKLNRSFFKYAN